MVKFKGEAINDAATLQRRVGDTPVGDTVTLTVMRDGKPMDLTVTIGSQADAMRRMAASLEDRLGVVVRPLKADEVSKYGLEPGQGVAIASVTPHGALGAAGFEKDDVILSVNNVPVQDVEGFVALIKSLPPHQQVFLKALDHRTGQGGMVRVTLG